MNSAGPNENVHSRFGHNIANATKPSNTKQPIATHPAACMPCLASVWPPKNDVVMAAAAINAPARVRSSTTDRS